MRPAAVLGIGNEFRGDDAAGVLVVRALRAQGGMPGWELHESSGEGTGLLDAWNARPRIVLVDAMVLPDAAPGTVVRFDAANPVPADAGLRCSSHVFGVADALALGKALGRLPDALVIYGIAGAVFTLGAAPSAAVTDAVARVAGEIRSQEALAHA